VYRPAGWVASFSWHQEQRVLPVEDIRTPGLYYETRPLPCKMRIRAATARTDSKIQKGARSQRDQPGQRITPASQAPGLRDDDPVVAAARGCRPESQVDGGLSGEPRPRSGDPSGVWQLAGRDRRGGGADGQVALTQAGSPPARQSDLASPHVHRLVSP